MATQDPATTAKTKIAKALRAAGLRPVERGFEGYQMTVARAAGEIVVHWYDGPTHRGGGIPSARAQDAHARIGAALAAARMDPVELRDWCGWTVAIPGLRHA